MALSSNQQVLIKQLESEALINGRYENLICISVNGNDRRGALSFVFQAYDQAESCPVAIKVMDPDRLHDKYRIASFEREPELLEIVEGKKRCLQLKNGLQYYEWDINHSSVAVPLKFNCGYFVTEWIEEDVDDYFYNQDQVDPEVKLLIYRKLLLAVEAIHRSEIFHRDMKVDNIRLKSIGDEQIVVVIDYGTAARHDTPSLSSAYAEPVGAGAFAPPEAFVGFSGDRELGHLADNYALGCLLYDLFNTREFRHARASETPFRTLIHAVGSVLVAESSRDGKLRLWREQMKSFHSLATAPVIDGAGNSIPPCIAPILKRIYAQLIDFDFNERASNLSHARRLIDSSLKVLSHNKINAAYIKRKRLMRKQKQERVRLKQERLNQYLTDRVDQDA